MRVEWSDIVAAARETSEALNGKAWVQAGIKARVLLADLADEVERLRAGNEALKNGLHLAWTDINQWLQLAGHQRDMMGQDLGWCPTQAGIDASRDRLACISEALRHAQSGQADVQAKRAEKLHANVAALAAVDPPPPARDRCEACGRFIAEGKARVLFTPDTDFGPEMTEVYCEPCDDRHRAAFRRIAGYERPY